MLHDTTEDPPRCAERAADGAADLRAAEPRVVAHWDLDDPGATPGRLDDRLDWPAVRCLTQVEGLQEVLACGTKRSQVGERDAAEHADHRSCETVAEHRMPRHRARPARPGEPGANDQVGDAGAERRQQPRHLRGPVAVVAVEEDDDVGARDVREAGETGTPVATPRLAKDAGAGPRGDLRSRVRRDDV